MPIKVINASSTDTYAQEVAQAAEALRSGALVAFPTETIYGIGVNASLPASVNRLRTLKRNPPGTPFTLHLGQKSDARRYLSAPSPVFKRLVRKLWPGPFTIVCSEAKPSETEIAKQFPAAVSELYHEGKIGMRCPEHAAAQRLFSEAAVPIVAAAANRPDEPTAHDSEAARICVDDNVDFLIDGGQTRYSAPSTVIEVVGNRWSMVREGVFDEHMIRRRTQTDVLFVCTGNSCRSPLAEYMARQRLVNATGLSAVELRDMGITVRSAGIAAYPGAPVSSGTAEELRRRGIDASTHRSQPLTVELVHNAERIFVMSAEHRSAVLALVPAASAKTELLDKSGSIADPIGGGPEDYRRAAEQIERALDVRLKELLDEDLDWQ